MIAVVGHFTGIEYVLSWHRPLLAVERDGAGSGRGSHGFLRTHRRGSGRFLTVAYVHFLDQLGVLVVLDANGKAAFVKDFRDQAKFKEIIDDQK